MATRHIVWRSCRKTKKWFYTHIFLEQDTVIVLLNSSHLWRQSCCIGLSIVSPLYPQTNLEHDVYSRLTTLQEGLIPKKKAGSDDDMHRINELIQVRGHTRNNTKEIHARLLLMGRPRVFPDLVTWPGKTLGLSYSLQTKQVFLSTRLITISKNSLFP